MNKQKCNMTTIAPKKETPLKTRFTQQPILLVTTLSEIWQPPAMEVARKICLMDLIRMERLLKIQVKRKVMSRYLALAKTGNEGHLGTYYSRF